MIDEVEVIGVVDMRKELVISVTEITLPVEYVDE